VALLSVAAVVYVTIILLAVAICRAAAQDDAPVAPDPRIGPLLHL
jgi:hypothetical protein